MERTEAIIIGGTVIGIALIYYAARRATLEAAGEYVDNYESDLGIFEGARTAVEDIVTSVKSGVRGIRNNNPGNIDRTSDRWVGMAADQSGDPRFVVFTEMKWGVRAIAVLMHTYRDKYGLNTVRGIISKWAPSRENNTGAYVAAVSSVLGVSPDDTIDIDDDSTMFALVRAIIAHENGRAAALLVSDTAVRAGIEAA